MNDGSSKRDARDEQPTNRLIIGLIVAMVIALCLFVAGVGLIG